MCLGLGLCCRVRRGECAVGARGRVCCRVRGGNCAVGARGRVCCRVRERECAVGCAVESVLWMCTIE